MANPLLNTLLNNPITGAMLSLFERIDIAPGQLLRVITYHRVANPAATPNLYPRITIHPDLFEQHMRFLNQHCQVVSMEDVLRTVRSMHPLSHPRPTRVGSEWGARQAEPFQSGWMIPETGAGEPAAQPDSNQHTTAAQPSRPPFFSPGHKHTLPRRAVLITFDDATEDFADYALPVLKRYNLPATVFVPTAFPGNPQRPFWWDQLYNAVEHAYNLGIVQTPLGSLAVETPTQRRNTFSLLRDYVKSLPHLVALDWIDRFCSELEAPRLYGSVLTWDALRELRSAGITLGPHTRNHPMLNRITPDEARAEMVGSWQDLRRETGDTLPIFAFPGGGYNHLVLEVLRQEGFELAFTTQRGRNYLPKADPLQLNRINAGPHTSLNVLRAQLLAI